MHALQEMTPIFRSQTTSGKSKVTIPITGKGNIEAGIEAQASSFPFVDTEAAINVAIWSGVPVKLNSFYKPFRDSLLAQSEDELLAIRDIAYVQDHLQRAHSKLDTLHRGDEFLTEEAGLECNIRKKQAIKGKQIVKMYYNNTLSFYHSQYLQLHRLGRGRKTEVNMFGGKRPEQFALDTENIFFLT